ncbi:MAG: Calx-beta domain-containing protein [Pseudomonadota bacterium]
MVGRGQLGKGLGFVGAVVLGGGLLSPAFADSFHLKDGQVIDGSVLRGTINTVTVQSASGIQLITFAQIDRAVIALADGSELAGEIISWRDGVFEIQAAGEVLRVADGEVLSDRNAAPETTAVETAAAVAPATTITGGSEGETTVMRSLPNFTMKNGNIMAGKVLHATGSVLTIKPEGASTQPISRAQIELVTFESASGEPISGKLLGWEDDVYQLLLDGDRELLAMLPDDATLVPPTAVVVEVEDVTKPLDTAVAAENDAAEAASSSSSNGQQTASSADAPKPAESGGVGGPVNETEVAGLAENQAAEPAPTLTDGQHLIEALVDAVDEGGVSAVVKFQLSKPAARPLVVLYAATEASAKAGEDFEAKSGVITFATGSSYAEVQVPIIDDNQGEDSEKFNLFLSGDPETIAFSKRQIAVTITDND